MERTKLEQKLWDIKISKDGCEILEVLAEFDRLKLRVASLAADLWDANAALDEAQSWLGTISEPATNGMSDLPGLIGLWNRVQDYLDSQEKPRPADSQKTSENPTLRERLEYHTEHHEGKFLHCLICNPKQEQEK